MQFAQVNVIGEGVIGVQVDRHQLQLVRVGNGGRVFGQQERTGVTVAHPPSAGEVPVRVDIAIRRSRRGEIGQIHHIGGCHADPAGAGCCTSTGGYP